MSQTSPTSALANAVPGAGAMQPTQHRAENDDPYGQLGDLEFGHGGAGGYQTDIPRPRGAEEDLLF